MKIVSWNINYRNKKIDKLLQYALSINPDIVCIQEFPEQCLQLLDNYSDYKYFHTIDLKHKSEKQSMLTLTLLKNNLIVKKDFSFKYFSEQYSSPLRTIYDKYLYGMYEVDFALIVDLDNIRIINTRLSTATGPTNRIKMLKNILEVTNDKKNVLLCGDLNTTSNIAFNLITGGVRGYSLSEAFFNEKKEVNKILSKYKFVNNFDGFMTSSVHLIPTMQLDYIATKNIIVLRKYMDKNTFGSDHKMLVVETQS